MGQLLDVIPNHMGIAAGCNRWWNDVLENGPSSSYADFFDINELAAIRMENPVVFRETHRLILRLIEEGKVTGVRLDHPDGLFDPPRYFWRLQQERLAQAVHARTPDPRRSGRPLYVVVEKILGRGERLPGGWPVHGTIGYEFLNLVGGLFVDQRNEKAMTTAYAAFTGQGAPFADIVYESKKLIVRASMSSELSVLGHALDRLAERNRHSRDFTRNRADQGLPQRPAGRGTGRHRGHVRELPGDES